ncbi:MAG TPA: methyltransferase domain-containing protein [Vicinamibacteria bacterium]
MNACTIIAGNYLAYARVLAESFRSHHPQGCFSVLLLDDAGCELPADREAFHLVRPQDIMDPQEFNRLSLIYDVTELATAVKPWLMRHLLKDGQPEVVFFDPDIQIFSPLDDIADLARRHSIVLTPHDIEPMPRDRSNPSEIQVLQSGAYNLGFIAVGSGAASFLDWWTERLRRHCVSAPEQGLFVDQRWIDFVPGYFDHFILKDPGCNVAYWNLSNRNLIWNGFRYLVNGEELRFFHFSGFDPERPHLLSRHSLPSPRVLLSEHPALRRVCQAYAKELLAHGHRSLSQQPYGLGALQNGLRIDRRMRWIYREALLAFEQRRGEEPPAANGDPDALVRWFNEPVVRSPGASVSRYLHSVYSERVDLQLAFPDLSGKDGERYLSWVRETGVNEVRIPGAFLPLSAPSARSARSEVTPCASAKAPSDRLLLPGVNVVGYFRAELGVGEAARQLVAALEQVGVPYATVTLEDTASRQEHPFENGDADTPYDINIICVNADMLPSCAKKLGREFFDRRYTIGLWHWEVSTFPKEWHGSFAHLDEIWVASAYTAAALSPVSPKPVHVIPPPVTPPLSSNSMRAELGLPEGFLFLFIYDFMSVFLRKNPLALIEAFGRAFAPGEGPVLVLKSINGESRIEDFEQVKVSAAEHPDVLVLDRYFSRESMIGLISSCDCYVSLHRAEGFGLTMAEAMVTGRPVIATGFSGNLMFMNEENAYLVRHEVVPIPEGCAPYPAGGEWAEPDIEDAARLMRHVYEHPEEALEKGRRARKDLLDRDRPSVRAELIGRRLLEIRQARTALERSEAEEAAPEPAATEPAAPQPRASQPAELEPSGPSTHDRAYFRSMEFPGNPWETTIRFRPLLPLARSLLFRLLRPHTASLAAFHRAILEESLELGQRIDGIVREAIPALQKEVSERDGATLAVVRELEQRVDALEREMIPAILDEAGEERKRAGDRLASMKKRVGLIEEKMGRAFGRHGDIERHLVKLVSNVSEFQDAAKAHLASLTASVSAGEQTLERLSRELYALPHTAEPMRVRAADGRECIGYDGNEGSSTPVDVYPSFEDSFRGPQAFIKDRLHVYLDMVRDKQPVVDIGCGRGEFLDLLAESGLRGVGVDVNPGMVERCRRRGHEVELADAADYLAARADGSIGCIFSAHLIEHLPFESLLAIIRLSRSKLSRNGLFIAETVNPHSIAAMKNFWVDLTHQKPIFPEVAVTLCRLLAFKSARIFFPRGNGNLEEDLWQQGEYAVVASAS